MPRLAPLLLLLTARATHGFGLRPSGGVTRRHGLAMSASPSTGIDAVDKCVVRFRDPTTGGRVALVGTMHFNPYSDAAARRTVRAAIDDADAGGLAALVVEVRSVDCGRLLLTALDRLRRTARR